MATADNLLNRIKLDIKVWSEAKQSKRKTLCTKNVRTIYKASAVKLVAKARQIVYSTAETFGTRDRATTLSVQGICIHKLLHAFHTPLR